MDPGDSDTWVLTEIYSETCTQSGFTANPSDFMTWTLDVPVSLSAGTEYGIDVGMTSTTTPWQDGIAYIKYSTADEYAGGTRYWSGQRDTQTGVIPGVGNSLMNNVSGDRVFHIDMLIGDPNAPSVDAGANWISWSGQGVDPNAVISEKEPTPWTNLSYAWTADAPAGVTVEFDPPEANVIDPTVTITKGPGDAVTVTLTLAVSGEGKPSPVTDTMTIDVYDDACLAKIAAGVEAAVDPGDLTEDCITNLDDVAELALRWFVDYALTEPVPK